MRLTELNRPKPTTVAATLVLVAAAMLAGRGDAADPFARTVALESGGVAAPVTDRALRAPELPAVSVGEAKVKHDKGTPELASSAYSDLDIPDTALAAYQRAAVVMEQVDESCSLSWTLLAAIGRVESDHGRYAGSQLLSDGTSSPEIRGVPLDGRGPVAKIPDTDGGRLDRDTLWDRAVGPMQFLPSTWSVVGVDADSDGVRSPHDIDDASLATGVFLCSAPGSLDTRAGLRTAILRYNPSSSYVASVLAVERAYRAGDFDTPVEVAQADSLEILTIRTDESPAAKAAGGDLSKPGTHRTAGAAATARHHADPSDGPHTPGAKPSATPDPGADGTPSADPSPSGTPDPSPSGTPDPSPSGTPDPSPSGTPDPSPSGTPDPSPSGTPDPSPSGTPDPSPSSEPIQLTGVLSACGDGYWCLGESLRAVGDASVLASGASADFDGDGSVETNGEELSGLVGTEPLVFVVPDTSPAVVVSINGAGYGF